MKKICFVVLLCIGLLIGQSFAAELGRHGLINRPAGSGIATTTTYNDFLDEGTIGLDISINWNNAHWDVKGEEGSPSDTAWTPQVSVFYGLNDAIDVRFSYEPFSLEDDQASLDMTRIGIGGRARKVGTSVIPFAEMLVNYYTVSCDGINDIQGTFGVSAEVGISYQVSDFFLINFGVKGETFLAEADGNSETTGNKAPIAFNSFGLGVGTTLLF